jgi:hypothetical protein
MFTSERDNFCAKGEGKMKGKKTSSKFIIAGLIIILLAPFVPDFLMTLINSEFSIYDYRYLDIRLPQIIPSVRIFGIGLAVWGFILKVKEE